MSDPELFQRLRNEVLGEPVYTVDELMAATGTDRSFADELWLALGFPLKVDEQQKEYSESDADALRSLNGLLSLDLVEVDRLLAMTRVMGQAMARLAAAQADMFAEELEVIVTPDDEDLDDEARAAVTELLVPGVERFVGYTFRRHLLAAFQRVLTEGDSRPVIGFVDVVDFTRTTRKLDADELATLVARFERHVYASVTNSGARLRKLLGDGVMFDAPDAAVAASAALNLVMACAEDPHLAGARGGLATGPMLEMEGDVYGTTVNRASRLAELAHPNSVIGDAEVGEALQGVPGFAVRPLDPKHIKGLGKVRVSVIRPAIN